MREYEVGDRVEYVGTTWPARAGQQATVVEDQRNTTSIQIRFDGDSSNSGVRAKSIRIAPAQSVITINRADLPEVREVGRDLMSGDGRYGFFLDAAGHRKCALQQLAVAEFLEAREKAAEEVAAAEKEAKTKLDKRRDVMAREMYLEAFGKDDGISYQNRNLLTQLCIDRIIELEDAAK